MTYSSVIISLLISLVSCSVSEQMIQKAYVPAPPAVAVLNDSTGKDLKIKGNFTILEFQYFKGINKNNGISSKVLLRTNLGGGITLGAFRHTTKGKKYFEVASGLGYYYFYSRINSRQVNTILPPILPGGEYYSHTIKCNYINWYLQPAVALKSKDGSFGGFSVNISNIFFPEYNYSFTINPYTGTTEGANWEVQEMDNLNTKNMYALKIEPCFFFKIGSKKAVSFFMQFGYSFDVLYNINKIYYSDWFYIFFNDPFVYKHPAARAIILNYGITVNPGKRKTDNFEDPFK